MNLLTESYRRSILSEVVRYIAVAVAVDAIDSRRLRDIPLRMYGSEDERDVKK